MMTIRPMLFVLVACVSAPGVLAQNLKPGLWEISNRMKSGSGEIEKSMAQMKEQLASMPPGERRMMEEMMAKQGAGMGAGGPGAASRICLTKDMIERNELPADRGECRVTKQERRGNTIHVAYQCSNPPSSGEGRYTVTSPEAYTMNMTVRTRVQGKSETVNMDGTGKWVGANCGNVKPVK